MAKKIKGTTSAAEMTAAPNPIVEVCKKARQQEIFDFLKENMFLGCDREYGSYGGGDFVEVKLMLNDPETGKTECISSASFSIEV